MPIPYYQPPRNVICKQNNACLKSGGVRFDYPVIAYIYVIARNGYFGSRSFICDKLLRCRKPEIDPGFGIPPSK